MSEWPAVLESLRASVGLWSATLDTLEPSATRSVARRIEDEGWSALWVPEAWGREAFSNAHQLLAATSSLVVGTGIANIWGRDAVAAMNASRTLGRGFHQRFVAGLGVSHQPLVERLRHQRYERPLEAMREYLEAMDQVPMFAPEQVEPVARVLAALGPRMLELARSHADGALTYLVTPAHTATARAVLDTKFLAVEQAVVLGSTREEFLRRAHAHLEIYTGLTNYRASWRRQGFEERDVVRGGSTRLCEAMVVHGSVDVIGERVREHFDSGADHVCLQVLGATDGPPREDWTELARALTT